VAIPVVDGLEVVDVEHQQRQKAQTVQRSGQAVGGAAARLGRRTALTVPLLPPPQKN
jgi:hypothetical protein